MLPGALGGLCPPASPICPLAWGALGWKCSWSQPLALRWGSCCLLGGAGGLLTEWRAGCLSCTHHPVPGGWTLWKNVGFCLGGGQKRVVKGPAGEGSLSASHSPPGSGSATPAGEEPFLRDLASIHSAFLLRLPFCRCARLSVPPRSVWKSRECGSELEKSRRRARGEKRDLGLSRPLRFLLKSPLDSLPKFCVVLDGRLAFTRANLHSLHSRALSS